jgi:hypothetical protein
MMMYTMLSIGYGDSDLVPRTDNEYVYFIFCMLILLTTLTVSLERVRLLLISRRIFLQDFCEALPNVMLREARRECRPNPTFTQDEFVLLVLEEHHVVDRDLINSIRKDFGRIENFGMGKIAVGIGNGEIEVGTVFEHLVSRGHILDSNRVDPTSTREDRNRKREAQRKAKSSTVFDRLTYRRRLSHHRHSQSAVVDDVLPDAVVEYVAEKDQTNIRELEGALNRILALSQLTGRSLTLSLAMEALTGAGGGARSPAGSSSSSQARAAGHRAAQHPRGGQWQDPGFWR